MKLLIVRVVHVGPAAPAGHRRVVIGIGFRLVVSGEIPVLLLPQFDIGPVVPAPRRFVPELIRFGLVIGRHVNALLLLVDVGPLQIGDVVPFDDANVSVRVQNRVLVIGDDLRAVLIGLFRVLRIGAHRDRHVPQTILGNPRGSPLEPALFVVLDAARIHRRDLAVSINVSLTSNGRQEAVNIEPAGSVALRAHGPAGACHGFAHGLYFLIDGLFGIQPALVHLFHFLGHVGIQPVGGDTVQNIDGAVGKFGTVLKRLLSEDLEFFHLL